MFTVGSLISLGGKCRNRCDSRPSPVQRRSCGTATLPPTKTAGPPRRRYAAETGRPVGTDVSLRQVELPVLGAADEGQPLLRREQQHCPGPVLRVTQGHGPADERDLDAVVGVRTTASALAPRGTLEVHAEAFGFDFHYS